jgi:hypothetical protein
VAPRPVNPGKPLVQVLMPFTTLLGADDQPCELVGHGPITADQAREIAADAVLKRLVYDPLSGALLDHGRTTYRPPPRWPTTSAPATCTAGARSAAAAPLTATSTTSSPTPTGPPTRPTCTAAAATNTG